jgi:AGZA family xanthine/uracil permease-like MFS transporter
VLTTLVARVELPFKLPGAVGSLLVGGLLYYALKWAEGSGVLPSVLALPPELQKINPSDGLFPTEWLAVFTFEWLGAWQDALHYLPIVIPFALATVVGGIDCTESAAAVGDEFDTGQVIGVEAIATLVAALCGGVVQTTPYIGHPAYKAMGGRAAYVLATALFIGSAGVLGYFGYLYLVIPKVTIFPILVFIGLEISAQSFHATPQRHYPAVVLACVPALAQLALLFVDEVFGDPLMFEKGVSIAALKSAVLIDKLTILRMLSGGFIITSLLWASALAAIIDRRLARAAGLFLVCAGLTLFGIMHSPLPGSPMLLPWKEAAPIARIVTQFAVGYVGVAIVLFAWGTFCSEKPGEREA